MIDFVLYSVTNPSVDGLEIQLPACPREGDMLQILEGGTETYEVTRVTFKANWPQIRLTVQFRF